jgi:APA family basic amino acid/polyamine antiporter
VFDRAFRRKRIADIAEEARSQDFKRTLGPWDLIALGIGGIIGTGIFVLVSLLFDEAPVLPTSNAANHVHQTGKAAASHAGPAIVVSFLLAGIASCFSALCYAELASVIPVSGSAYSFGYYTLGEAFAWLIG